MFEKNTINTVLNWYTWEMKTLNNEIMYSVGKKPPTPILCVTEKIEQNRNEIASNIF